MITHPLDDGVRAFYAKWGFQDLPFDPRRAMMVRMIDLKKNMAGKAVRPRAAAMDLSVDDARRTRKRQIEEAAAPFRAVPLAR